MNLLNVWKGYNLDLNVEFFKLFLVYQLLDYQMGNLVSSRKLLPGSSPLAHLFTKCRITVLVANVLLLRSLSCIKVCVEFMQHFLQIC